MYKFFIPKFDISGISQLAKADSQTKKNAAWIGCISLLAMGGITVFSYRLKNKHEKKKTDYEVRGYKEMREADLDLYKAKKEIDAKYAKPSNSCTELKTIDDDASSTPGTEESVILGGMSTGELFNRPQNNEADWLVDGYMGIGLVNLLCGGGGAGKSIAMTQIARAVAMGERPEFLPETSLPSKKMCVMYYRLEDFPCELGGKYGDGQVLMDTEITWYLSKHLPENNLNGFLTHLKELAKNLKSDTLVCADPITKLSNYKHDVFIKGVELAQEIARSNGVTLTIVASVHLDELKPWSSITTDDVKGGDQAVQQAGSVTAIRKARKEGFCYLVSLKEPKGHPKPFDGEVLVAEIFKSSEGTNKYVHFKHSFIASESSVIPIKTKHTEDGATKSDKPGISIKQAPNQKLSDEAKRKISEERAAGKSVKALAKEYNVSEKTIARCKPKKVA